MRRLLPPLLFVICLLAGIGGHLFWPVVVWLTAPYTLLGLVPLALGLWLLVRAGALFAQARTNIHTFRDPDVLVTDGPFRVSRNPMYLGFLALLTACAVGLGTLPPLLACLAFFLAANYWYIPFEERACESRFGDAYRHYRGTTRRWL